MRISATTALPPPSEAAGTRPQAGERAIAWWLLFCCGMIFVMVVIGGVTRLTLSGLSITEWQPVTGTLPPLSDAAWAAEFEKYRQIPQYQLLNHGHEPRRVQNDLLVGVFAPAVGPADRRRLRAAAVYFLVRRQVPRRLILPLAGIFLLGFAQGALGWYMVKSGLADRVSVSQYRLVAHLALALLIYAATLWIALGILATAARRNPSPSPPFSGEREGPAPKAWEGEVGTLDRRRPAGRPARGRRSEGSALESPTSPQPSPPEGERGYLVAGAAPPRRSSLSSR